MTGCNRPPWSKESVVSLWERRRSENPTSKQHRGARRNLLATDSCSSLSNRGSSMRTKHHGYIWYGTISLLHRQVTKCITQKKSRLTPKGSRPSSRNALSTPLPSKAVLMRSTFYCWALMGHLLQRMYIVYRILTRSNQEYCTI